MNNLPVCQDLITTDNIENEFVLNIYEMFNKGKMSCKDQRFFNKRIRYSMMEQTKLLDKYKLSIHDIVLAFKYADSDEIPVKFKPEVKVINPRWVLDSKYIPSIKAKLKTILKTIKKSPPRKISRKQFQNIIKFTEDVKLTQNIKFYKLTFKKSVISLMIQRKWEPKISALFTEYTKVVGVDFDQYIEDWAKRLMNEP